MGAGPQASVGSALGVARVLRPLKGRLALPSHPPLSPLLPTRGSSITATTASPPRPNPPHPPRPSPRRMTDLDLAVGPGAGGFGAWGGGVGEARAAAGSTRGGARPPLERRRVRPQARTPPSCPSAPLRGGRGAGAGRGGGRGAPWNHHHARPLAHAPPLPPHALPHARADPFADTEIKKVAAADSDAGGYVHVRVQQRNGRKCLTTVQGLPDAFDLKKIIKALKKGERGEGWGG